MRLEPTGFGRSICPRGFVHAARIHRIMCQRSLFEQILNLCAVEGVCATALCEPTAHLRLFAVTDRLNQQFPQWAPLELQLPSTSNT